MKNIILNILNLIEYVFIGSSLFLCFSCGEKDEIVVDNVSQTLNSISTAWGSSPTEIRNYMNGYTTVKDNDGKTLIYKNRAEGNYLSYRFINNKLSAALLLIGQEGKTAFDNLLSSYKYIGNLDKDMIYQSLEKNTIATINMTSDKKEYSSIGFAPLRSDEYEKAEPYGVNTELEINVVPTKVTLYGSLNGVEKEVEVGFMLSLSPDMEESNSRKTKLKSSKGRFDATLNGILDQETYYYCAYAIIDEIPYYGEVRSFETGPLTYTVNGKEFQVIKVEGGPYGDFSMLQTEISANDKVVFAGIDLGMILDCDKIDGNISLYESKKFIGNLLELTSLAWRYPTSSEWKFAAEGGLKSNKYTYSGSDDIDKVAWYENNCAGPRKSGLKKANELGLYDMSGNFAELTNDMPIKDLETNIYLTGDYYSWNKSYAYGGRWDTKAASCKTNSYEETKQIEKYLIDGKKYALRLVYSHHINAYKY